MHSRRRLTNYDDLAERRTAACLARPAPDDLAPRRAAQPPAAGRLGAVAGRLLRAGPPLRRPGRAAPCLRDRAGPALGAEPALAPPRADAAPRSGHARGVRVGPARRLRRTHSGRARG